MKFEVLRVLEILEILIVLHRLKVSGMDILNTWKVLEVSKILDLVVCLTRRGSGQTKDSIAAAAAIGSF